MQRITILVLLSLGSISTLMAQTPKENLEKAVELYNADRTYQSELNPKTLTDEKVSIVKSRMDKGLALLDQVTREGNADQVKVARYFRANFYYSYFFTLGMKGKNAEAYELNKTFEADITSYKESDFPMSYDYFDKKFTIKWDNFSLTQAEYYTGFGEICYNMGKYADAIRFAKLALEHPGVSSYFKYIAVNKILDAVGKDPSLISSAERLDYYVKAAVMYDEQDEANKEVIKENNYPTTKRASSGLISAMQSDNSAVMQQRCATVAPIAAKYEGSKDLALQLYSYCYKNKYDGSESFHNGAVQLAKATFPVGTAESRASAQNIGDAALTALVAKVAATDCEKFKMYAVEYQAIGLASKGLSLEQRSISCIKSREAAAKKAEALRQKQARRASRNFNVYLGVDVIPLLTSVDKMDFGGHLDFRGKRVAHSFGFALVNARKDYNSSRTRWDGNRYFYAIKFFTKKDEAPSYSGLYFGYSEKTFENLLSVTATSEDGTDIRNFNDFTPIDKQYELMWNSGMQALGKPFGVDFWFGIGASYNQLSFKELDPADGYTFAGNDFFDNRKKLESFNLKMRMGVSVGLNFGKKR